MYKLPDVIKTFSINATGEITKLPYVGVFRAKIILTNADRIEIERKYNMLLSSDSTASENIKLRASALAELEVRVLDGPRWWQDSLSGKNLIDIEPIWAILIKINELAAEWQKEVEKMADSLSFPINHQSTEVNFEDKNGNKSN